MTPIMIGPVVLLAALASPFAPAPEQAAQSRSNFQPTSSATAHATVSIRIISGVQFGEGRLVGAENAIRRQTQLTDATGASRQAEIVEFQ
jgi:hypothetical protein